MNMYLFILSVATYFPLAPTLDLLFSFARLQLLFTLLWHGISLLENGAGPSETQF